MRQIVVVFLIIVIIFLLFLLYTNPTTIDSCHITRSKYVIMDNQIKTNELDSINKRIELDIHRKNCLLQDNRENIELMIELNSRMNEIIKTSNQEVEIMIEKYKEIADLNLTYSNLGQITNNIGENLINGKDKDINMDSTSVLLKCNLKDRDNYYIPAYKIE